MDVSGAPPLLVQFLAHIGGGQLQGLVKVLFQAQLLFGFFELMLCDGVIIAEPQLEVVRPDCFFNIF
jgi:hypothetical protein